MQAVQQDQSRRLRRRKCLPASLMRAGTSRGLFIHQKYLPQSSDDWKPWILAAMGSKSGDVRQLDGVGGATSTTSKVAVIKPSEHQGIDVEYTFIQVAIGKETLDFSGNCGNMASGVGPFAVEEGLVRAEPGATHVDVSILNTNTGKRIVETVEVDDEGQYCEEGDYVCPGVKVPGSEVKVAFMSPEGSMTGKLFPNGERTSSIHITEPRNGVAPFEVQASLVDAANPFIIVDSTSLPLRLEADSAIYLDLVEDIRRAGAVQMGLATDMAHAATTRGTPKIAFVSPGEAPMPGKQSSDVRVAAMSMGKAHPSLQLTGAVCLGAASCIPGTVPYAAREATRRVRALMTPPDSEGSDDEASVLTSSRKEQANGEIVWLQHPSGQIKVVVKLHRSDDEVRIESCSVSRTARKIFDGQVMVNL
jgi:2-methylaconitate cis-trans-isomerase PrpF